MTFSSSPTWRSYIAAGMIGLLLLPSTSNAEMPAIQGKADTTNNESGSEEVAQPKFVWGILIDFIASKAFQIFFDWASKKVFQGMEQSLTIAREAAVSAPGAATLAIQRKSSPIVPNVTDSVPSSLMVVENGKENYQGAILSLLVLQPDGRSLTVRPISAGFKSGEKFRIRIGATFDGELSLDNINPQGERSRLYPAQTDQIVKMKSGTPVILPLDKDSFFQFDNVAGEEKLVITLRDPRAQGDAAAQTLVHRQENAQGTGLLQEVVAGKFAVIAESIALQHR